MTKAITSKELRTRFPWVKEEAEKGTTFIVYYRSKPVLEVKPFAEPIPKKDGKPTWEEWKAYKQEIIRELGLEKQIAAAKRKYKGKTPISVARSSIPGWQGWEKMIIKGGKPFSAVDLIRKDREET